MKKEDISLILRQHNLKSTPLRAELFKVMSGSKTPLKIQKIHSLVEKKISADLVTVYRNIKSFTEVGFVQKITAPSQEEFLYEFVYGKDHHHKIICPTCSLCEEICDDEIEKIVEKLLKKSKKFKKEERHLFEIFAYCKKCTF